MELTISEKQAKELLKQALVELMEEKRDLCIEVLVQAIEEIGLANAIRQGRQGEFVSSVTKTLRPFGLCAGEFTVPDDFDDPLPTDIIEAFEGR